MLKLEKIQEKNQNCFFMCFSNDMFNVFQILHIIYLYVCLFLSFLPVSLSVSLTFCLSYLFNSTIKLIYNCLFLVCHQCLYCCCLIASIYIYNVYTTDNKKTIYDLFDFLNLTNFFIFF